MASLQKQIITSASPDQVWDALRDLGALHTRLVPGFVVNTRLEPGTRIVTFGNGMVIREPIIAVDDALRRVVWSAIAAEFSHYNAAAQVFAEADGRARVVWTVDFLPNEAEAFLGGLMDQGLAAMQKALDGMSAADK